jgi:hypothetical protein
MTAPTVITKRDKARIGTRVRITTGLFKNQTGVIVGIESSTPIRFRVAFDPPVQIAAAGWIRSAWVEGIVLEDA